MSRAADSHSSPPKQQTGWRLRFSLRTLLVLVTALAVWLGYMTHRAREQERAVRAIQALGGTVVYDFELDADGNRRPNAEPAGPKWLRRLLGPHFGTNVVGVGLGSNDGKVTNKDLEVFRSLRGLRGLSLSGNAAITDEGLDHVAKLLSLTALDVGHTGISDAGLARIKNLSSLQSLFLGGTQITDEGLAHLGQMQKLSLLDLGRCRIDGSGLRHVRHLPITHLNLNWTTVTDSNLKHVGAMNCLVSLTMQDTPITDAGLAHLRGVTLRQLDIHNTAVSDLGLTHLERLSNLNDLQVLNTRVTDEGVQKLEMAVPNLSVAWPRKRPSATAK